MSSRKLVSALLVSAMLSAQTTALADTPQPTSPTAVSLPPAPEPLPGEPDVGAAISPMKRGQLAPFTGVLLSPRAVATVVAELNSVNDRIKIEIERVRGEEQARCDFRVSETRTALETDKKVLQARLDENQERARVLEDRLKQAEKAQPNALVWGLVGLGSGIGLTLLTVVAVSAASKQ